MTPLLSPAEASGLQLPGLEPSLRGKFEKLLATELNLSFDDVDPVWCDARRVLITGGYRAGKSTRAAFRGIRALLNTKSRLIWLVGPDYDHAREEFRLILEWGLHLGLIGPKDFSIPSDGSRWLRTITGCRIETKSAQHPERLASVAPDGIILCEPGQMPEEVFHMCIGRLIEKRGWLWMIGTLEDDETKKPRWAWYEKLAVEWLQHPSGSVERAFCVPTWSNKVLFPGGINDPEMIDARAQCSDYKWDRSYGGVPRGVENPVFPIMWESHDAMDQFFQTPEPSIGWLGGAIGVDYGTTFEHPSAVVVVRQDSVGRYWVSDVWQGIRAGSNEIASIVESRKSNFGVWQGMCDPNQRFMADVLGFEWAASGDGSTRMRLALVNELLETRALYFDRTNLSTELAWNSMRICRWLANPQGKMSYNRPLGDDAAMAVAYAIEMLRGHDNNYTPQLDYGIVNMSYAPDPRGGRMGRV